MKVKKTIYQNLLKVEITVPEAEYATDKKIKINTEQALEIAKKSEEYEILKLIKEGSTITNFLKNPHDSNTSLWIFLISKNEQESPKLQKNTRRKTSLRGRMSKIAKDVEQKED